MVIHMDPDSAFLELTNRLVESKKLFNGNISFLTGDEGIMGECFAHAFEGKTEKRFGARIPWKQWLVWGVFPENLYIENNRDLMRLLSDKRLYSEPRYAALDATNSFFGRLARPRPGLDEGFMHYTIRRWKDKTAPHKSQPHFYFDVEPPEWVWHDLVNNPKLVRTWRSSASCLMNVAFRWTGESPALTFIVKHANWSHVYGDIFGANALLKAFCKEIGYKGNAIASVYMISATMDTPKQAKAMLMDLKRRMGP